MYEQADDVGISSTDVTFKAPTVAEIVRGERLDLRNRIVSLFRENKTSPMIVDVLEKELTGDATRKRESLESLVRKVIVRVIPEEERKSHQITAHENRAQRVGHSSQYEGLKKAALEKGEKVWSPEENEYFLTLLSDEKFLRGTKMKNLPKEQRRLNHELLVNAMNERFGTTEFTTNITLDKLERMRRRAREASREQEDESEAA